MPQGILNQTGGWAKYQEQIGGANSSKWQPAQVEVVQMATLTDHTDQAYTQFQTYVFTVQAQAQIVPKSVPRASVQRSASPKKIRYFASMLELYASRCSHSLESGRDIVKPSEMQKYLMHHVLHTVVQPTCMRHNLEAPTKPPDIQPTHTHTYAHTFSGNLSVSQFRHK